MLHTCPRYLCVGRITLWSYANRTSIQWAANDKRKSHFYGYFLKSYFNKHLTIFCHSSSRLGLCEWIQKQLCSNNWRPHTSVLPHHRLKLSINCVDMSRCLLFDREFNWMFYEWKLYASATYQVVLGFERWYKCLSMQSHYLYIRINVTSVDSLDTLTTCKRTVEFIDSVFECWHINCCAGFSLCSLDCVFPFHSNHFQSIPAFQITICSSTHLHFEC